MQTDTGEAGNCLRGDVSQALAGSDDNGTGEADGNAPISPVEFPVSHLVYVD